MKKNLQKNGFTVIEMMTAMAVIGVLVAIAIPNVLKMRLRVNEAAAQTALGGIKSAMVAYHLEKDTYPSDLSQLAPGSDAPVNIEETVASGLKLGYRFQVASADRDTYRVTATPEDPTVSGAHIFVLTESGVIENGGVALTGIASATTSTPPAY